jgi:protein-tyrosine phosphatase
MAAALLARRLDSPRTPVVVHSAGILPGDLLPEGQPSSPEVISALGAYGLDLSGHRSRRVTPGDLVQADLVLGVSREHVRHAVVAAPDTWPRVFTLRELIRRGERTGPRVPGERLADWLARVHEGRERGALLGDSPLDDVADPIGGTSQAYADTATSLDELVGRLAWLCWGLTADSLPGQR